MSIVLLGDCLDLMDGIESGSIDMVLADLPYGTIMEKEKKYFDISCSRIMEHL